MRGPLCQLSTSPKLSRSRASWIELRVIANAHKTSDADAVRVCRDIARAIEQQLDYPGEIKVTVIRETRAVEFAK